MLGIAKFQMAQAASEPTTDPNIASVKFLMQAIGADGSTTFTDLRSHTITPVGGAKITTSSPLFPPSSAILAAATSDLLTVSASTDFQFTGDFTIEFTVKPTILTGGAQQVIGNYTANTTGHWAFRIIGSSNPIWYINGAGTFISVATSWVVNQTHSVALMRSGGTCYVFIDGVQVGSTAFSGTFGLTTNAFSMGGVTGGSTFTSCLIDEVRISNIARYTPGVAYVPRKTRFPTT